MKGKKNYTEGVYFKAPPLLMTKFEELSVKRGYSRSEFLRYLMQREIDRSEDQETK